MSAELLNNNGLVSHFGIEQRIFGIRGMQVMIDRDLAQLYGVEPKRLGEQVRRNIERFPEAFRFQLTEAEKNQLVANCDRFEPLKHSTTAPYAFTEQGVAMLSAVLRSDTAVKVSIQIMQAFVSMRRLLAASTPLLDRLDTLEKRQIANEIRTDDRFERVFAALEAGNAQPAQGVFFDGQVFDAYVFVNDLLRTAQKSIVLIDNYIDDTVLLQLSKRPENVSATILTKSITPGLEQDLKKYNSQYPPISIKVFPHSHDRFLILDDETVYHLGASLKDLGKRWFAFSRMEKESLALLARVQEVLG
ncbi:MAG: ORF6N domain-containing protein [Desulfuromonadales bacterium]